MSAFDASVAKFKALTETLRLERRDFYSRANRKVRDKAEPQARDLFRAARERRQRFNRHRLSTLNGKLERPRQILSSRFRAR